MLVGAATAEWTLNFLAHHVFDVMHLIATLKYQYKPLNYLDV